MIDAIPRWFVRTAISTSDSLCGAASPWRDGSRRRRPRTSCVSPPKRKYEEQNVTPSRGVDEDFAMVPEKEEQQQTSKNPLCMEELWRDLDPSYVASDLWSFATNTPSIPREVRIDPVQQQATTMVVTPSRPPPRRRRFELVPPRPLSRTAPRAAAVESTVPSSAATGISSLGTESLVFAPPAPAPEAVDEEEEEDSLLMGLEHVSFQGHRRAPPPPPSHKGSKTTISSASSQSSSVGFTTLLSPDIESPPLILRKAPVNTAINNEDAVLEEVDDCDESSFLADRHVQQHPLVQKPLTRRPVKHYMAPSLRDPPESAQTEGASTTCFTYSTQGTSGEESEDNEVKEYLSAFADGSSYSSLYYEDAHILHAAKGVKSLLQEKQHRDRFQFDPAPSKRKDGGGGQSFLVLKPNVEDRHWFLPSSSVSQISRTGVSVGQILLGVTLGIWGSSGDQPFTTCLFITRREAKLVEGEIRFLRYSDEGSTYCQNEAEQFHGISLRSKDGLDTCLTYELVAVSASFSDS